MASFKSFAAFGAELDKVAKNLDATQRRRITREMAEKGQRIADQEAARDLGSDRAFSGWNSGKPIPLDTHLKAGRNEATVLLPKFPGGWTVAEFGRNMKAGPRLIGPRLTRTGRVSKARVRRYNGVTQGKGTASDAAKVTERELPKIAEREYRKVLVKHFDVT